MMQNTKNVKINIKYRADFVNTFVSLSLFVLGILASSLFSPWILEDVKAALILCFYVIIPSVFPFMILSDLMLSYMHFENIPILRRAFSRSFKINGYAISAFLSGLICGFPVGVKLAKELYLKNKISKNECERLIGFSNNASPGFVISGVGYGLLGSLRLGFFIYLISVISTIVVGIIFGLFEKHEDESEVFETIPFALSDSVKKATLGTVSVCGFITFFSIILGFFKRTIKNEWILAFIAAFFEIGNATNLIAKSAFPREISISLITFAISFSGLSVHFQSKSILSGTDISMKKYYAMKFSSAVLSAIISTLALFIEKMAL